LHKAQSFGCATDVVLHDTIVHTFFDQIVLLTAPQCAKVEDTQSTSGSVSQVDMNETTVRIMKAVSVGNSIRPIGYDIQQGAVVLEEGTKITPAEVCCALIISYFQLLLQYNLISVRFCIGVVLTRTTCILRTFVLHVYITCI
jgi:MoeA N-terminal region (domain I and II)